MKFKNHPAVRRGGRRAGWRGVSGGSEWLLQALGLGRWSDRRRGGFDRGLGEASEVGRLQVTGLDICATHGAGSGHGGDDGGAVGADRGIQHGEGLLG